MNHRFLAFVILVGMAAAACSSEVPGDATAAAASVGSEPTGALRWPPGQLLPTFATPDKLDFADITRLTDVEQTMFATLQGIVNRTRPRLYFATGDGSGPGEGPTTWLDSLRQPYVPTSTPWALVAKYRSELTGIVIYDTRDATQLHTRNVATTIAGLRNALAVGPALAAKLTAAPYNLPVIEDLRGRFAGPVAMYQYLFDRYWSECTHRVLIGLSPTVGGGLRDYAVALGAAVVWLNPGVPAEDAALKPFLTSMPPGTGLYMGWWPEEQIGVERASTYGIATGASDFFNGATVFGGMPRAVSFPPIPPRPPLANKIYVSLIMSDGDNFQYMQHSMRQRWDSADRGKVPIGWTVSPLARDFSPAMLNWYWKTASANDVLISGPSGFGYIYPNVYPAEAMRTFVGRSAEYQDALGLRVITVWNTVNGGIEDRIGELYATSMPRLLGITTQNAAAPLRTYSSMLPSKRLDAKYAGSEADLLTAIRDAEAGWSGVEPLFVTVQAEAWHVNVTNLLNVARQLDARHVLVRPDHMFQLYREQNGLPIDGNSYADLSRLTFDFRDELQGWTPGTAAGDYDRAAWTKDVGDGSLVLDGSDIGHPGPAPNAWFRRDVQLPATVDSLEFDTRSSSAAHGGQLRVRLIDDRGMSHTLLDGDLTRSVTFVSKRVDLRAFAGIRASLIFEQNDSGEGVGEQRYVDNVRITSH